MRWRRRGQPAPPRAPRPAIEVSTRAAAAPGRIAGIRGLAELAAERRQTEDAWRELWADDETARGRG